MAFRIIFCRVGLANARKSFSTNTTPFCEDDKQPENAFFVKTFIDFARYFNIEVVAEMVETEAEYRFLQNYGIDYYQGYYFGKPMKDEDFELHLLSLTEKTFIAFNFNAFVVRVR